METDISCLSVEESYCSVCRETFLTPVVLCCVWCDLSFCNSCLEQFWKKYGTKECPLCFQQSLGLPQRSCGAHGQRQFLICATDLEPVCSLCPKVGLHNNHGAFYLKNAFKDHKVRGVKSFSNILLDVFWKIYFSIMKHVNILG